MRIQTDNIAMSELSDHGLVRYGIEFGNWYGFIGIPLNYGLGSFVNIEHLIEDDNEFCVTARIKMPCMHVRIKYYTRRVDGGISSDFDIHAIDDSLIGDIVIHSVFEHKDENLKFNNHHLKTLNKYIYSKSEKNSLHIGEKIININMELQGCSDVDLDSMPYAAKLENNRVRYHSRALSMGGDKSYALLRSRGSASCFNLGRYRSYYNRYLYRVERTAPKFLPNSQICSVTKLESGQKISLKHEVLIK